MLSGKFEGTLIIVYTGKLRILIRFLAKRQIFKHLAHFYSYEYAKFIREI